MKKVVLGLDISTSKIGICIMDYKFNLLETTLIKLNTKDELEDRCLQLEEYINNLNYNIKDVYVESAFIAFSGGKTSAVTMSKLQRFNGMVCFMIRKLLGIAYRKKVKKNTEVELLMGISYDEIYRMKPNRMPYIKNVFPLIDMRLTRQDCKNWFKKHYNVQPPRSACTYCPYHNDKEWDQMKKNNPKEFQEVVEFDKKIK